MIFVTLNVGSNILLILEARVYILLILNPEYQGQYFTNL